MKALNILRPESTLLKLSLFEKWKSFVSVICHSWCLQSGTIRQLNAPNVSVKIKFNQKRQKVVRFKSFFIFCFLKMGQTRTLPCSFPSFLPHNVKCSTKFVYKWHKHRWCAWDSNLGLQNGRPDESTELWETPYLVYYFTLEYNLIK